MLKHEADKTNAHTDIPANAPVVAPDADIHDLNGRSFVEAMGIRTLRADHGVSELALTMDARHLNRWSVAHGGVTMTLLDAALAAAARYVEGNERSLVTVEMKVTFMQPALGELRAHGRVLHRSSTMAYCDGEVIDSEGRLVAKALGTYKYLRRLPVGRDVVSERF
jgi:uncharacterized protein (TIGR00369 family)